MSRRLLPILVVAAAAACDRDSTAPPADEHTFDFDFTTQSHGWVAGFADYPVGAADRMDLESAHADLPDQLGLTGEGLYSAGTNHSDDLFMFWKGRVTGLRPNTTYSVSFDVEFATAAPSDCVGIGGPPGESVYFMAGASTAEPERVVREEAGREYYRMNIDKGNQSQGGSDTAVLGHVGNTVSDCDDLQWELKSLSEDDAVEVTTDSSGAAWLIVGTDSGFEGRTEIYHTSVRAEFRRP